MQPLDNIKVVDFSTLLPGPLAGLLLAEAGAQIVKIERPQTGEEMRHFQPRWGRDAINFALLNRGKKSLAIDLKDREQIKRLKPLISQADVLLEQFRPGVMDRLGLGYETMKQWNPRLIYCSISGYGQTGPKSDQVGHDLNYIGDTGLLDLSMGPADQPTIPPALIADIAGGTYPAVVNILLALINRQRTGQGAHLDIAMTDHLFMLMFWAQGQASVNGDWPKSGKGLLTGGSPRYQIYRTKDHKFVAAAPLEEKFWQNFCKIIGFPPQRETSTGSKAAIAEIGAIICLKTAQQWQEAFANQDCCCTIVKTLQQALQDNHFKYREIFEHQLLNDTGETVSALPVCVLNQFRNANSTIAKAPHLGASNSNFEWD